MTPLSSKIVCVFGSSRPAPGDPEYRLAYETGRELASAGFIVCNGGYGGVMEASARGASEAGGDTIGITTKAFPGKPPNEWIDTVVATDSLVERLLKLISTADAYIILKGGTGTLLELAAVWEFMNKTMMDEKPIIVIGNFWNEVVRTLNDELAWEGLENCTKFVTRVADPVECAKVLEEKFSAGGEWKR